jgi:hypothetical protein
MPRGAFQNKRHAQAKAYATQVPESEKSVALGNSACQDWLPHLFV